MLWWSWLLFDEDWDHMDCDLTFTVVALLDDAPQLQESRHDTCYCSLTGQVYKTKHGYNGYSQSLHMCNKTLDVYTSFHGSYARLWSWSPAWHIRTFPSWSKSWFPHGWFVLLWAENVPKCNTTVSKSVEGFRNHSAAHVVSCFSQFCSHNNTRGLWQFAASSPVSFVSAEGKGEVGCYFLKVLQRNVAVLILVVIFHHGLQGATEQSHIQLRLSRSSWLVLL